MMKELDRIDKMILAYLIKNAKISYNLLAQKIGISN
ncbi:MAG TPA: Lrp/AsnC family transcriptional regulator, partial [Bacteroidales bacterium]|nr:Lrp/AsnC family transcriptional regulator [Bacteroidales bacterium]